MTASRITMTKRRVMRPEESKECSIRCPKYSGKVAGDGARVAAAVAAVRAAEEVGAAAAAARAAAAVARAVAAVADAAGNYFNTLI